MFVFMLLKNVNRLLLAAAVGVVCLFSACSYQDFGRPISGPLSDIMESGKPYMENTDKSEALERSKRFAKALAEWQMESPEERPDYHIGSDDIVQLEILSFETPDKPSVLLRTVSRDNTINLSWAGTVEIGGLNVQEAEAALKKHLASYIKDPVVTLTMAEYKSAGIVITGAVSKPGVYYLKRDRRTLLEVLAQADGLDVNSGDELMLIRGKQSVDSATESGNTDTNSLIIVDLKQLIDSGNLRMNLWVERGDIITVLPRQSNYICVLGYVNRPGSFDISGKGAIDALKAVAMAGGLASTARAENSWLLRQTSKGQKMVPIDLTKLARGVKPPLPMESGDTLVVGSSLMAKLSEFVKVGGSVGAAYSPVP